MKTRVLAILIAAFALLAVACGTSPAASPTAEATPTAIPIDLINADPSTDAEAFRASLSLSERECYDGVVEEQASLQDAMGDSLLDAGMTGLTPDLLTQQAELMESLVPLAAMQCYDEDTAQRVYIGQMDRLAGGLSNESLNCMVERTNNTTFTGLFSDDEEVMKDALQADNIMSLLQSIFCLDSGERLVFETNLAGEQEGFRPGMIDGLECTVDYQDENGKFVVQDMVAQVSALTELDEEQLDGTAMPPEFRQLLASVFDLVPIVVECGLITDEDLADSGLTTDQLVCASNALKEPLLEFIDAAASDPDAAENMAIGLMADLFSALDQCNIDLNDIEGLDELFSGASATGTFDFSAEAPEIEVPSSSGDLSLDDLNQVLTQAQITCLMDNITEEELQLMVETGAPPANMFALLATCDISLEQFIEGF